MTELLHYASYFMGGIFLLNSIPHLAKGACGEAFQSPFANPSGKGLSSSIVNVLWGCANLFLFYLCVFRVGMFSVRCNSHIFAFGAGFLLAGIFNSWHFGMLHGGIRK